VDTRLARTYILIMVTREAAMADKKRTIDARGQVDLSAYDEKALRGELGYLSRKAAEARRDARLAGRPCAGHDSFDRDGRVVNMTVPGCDCAVQK
jgi:hypothetical protein